MSDEEGYLGGALPFVDWAKALRDRYYKMNPPMGAERPSSGATGSWKEQAPVPMPVKKPLYTDVTPPPPPARQGGGAPVAAPPVTAATVGGGNGMDPAYAAAMQDQTDLQRQVLGGSLGLAGLDDERAKWDEQKAYAEKLRDTALPEGREYGGVYMNSNPLEFLNTALRQHQGNKDRDKAVTEIDKVNTQRKGSLADLMRAIAGKSGNHGVGGWDPEADL